MKKRGMFIVFEGIDGSGKSTQLFRLMEHLESRNKYHDFLRTHEPWDNEEINKKLAEDKDAYSDADKMAELFVHDRIVHSNVIVSPNLEKKVFVLCDRYSMSTCAYQWAQGVDLNKLIEMHKDYSILTPDITFFLDVSVEIAQQRIAKRAGGLKEKFEDWEFQKKVLDSYHAIIKMAHEKEYLFGKVKKINGRGFVEKVAERIKDAFEPVYEEWKNL